MYRLPEILLGTSLLIGALAFAGYMAAETQEKLDDLAWRNRHRNLEWDKEVMEQPTAEEAENVSSENAA
jgi:hypothetical protein